MKRINVVGTSGSGKSHFSSRLAAKLGVPYIEMDAVFWLPNWQHLELEDFKNAKAHYEKALSFEPEYEPALGNLAVVYRNLGKIEKSLSCSNEAIKINPEKSSNYYKSIKEANFVFFDSGLFVILLNVGNIFLKSG